ncbi:MAG: STAS domain-containing protein [Alphaproteobacteria bacterium]|nr:STAS domain-containing protein [Alphaproteobacteria bacterium]
MEYVIRHDGAVGEVAFRGRWTLFDANGFKPLLVEISEAEPRDWRLDVTRVEFIDSAGLGMLLIGRDTIARKGGTATLAGLGVGGQVGRALKGARFRDLFAFEA